MDNITLITLVFLIPIFFAIIFNTFFRQKKNANLKIVYYKIFLFMINLYIASQIHIACTNEKKFLVEIFGTILMAILVFELFLLPDDATNNNDVLIVHEIVLWFLILFFIFNLSKNHFKDITTQDWNNIKLYRLDKVFSKVINMYSLTQKNHNFHRLPITNIFSGYFLVA